MSDDYDLLYQMIGERIRSARERLGGVSQARLASTVSRTRTSINNIENGRQKPPVHVLWEIAEALETEAALFIPTRKDYEHEQAGPTETDEVVTTLAEQALSGSASARQEIKRLARRMSSHRTKPE